MVNKWRKIAPPGVREDIKSSPTVSHYHNKIPAYYSAIIIITQKSRTTASRDKRGEEKRARFYKKSGNGIAERFDASLYYFPRGACAGIMRLSRFKGTVKINIAYGCFAKFSLKKKLHASMKYYLNKNKKRNKSADTYRKLRNPVLLQSFSGELLI